MQILASNPRYAHKVAYKLSYCVHIVAAAGVKEVTCASHDAAARVHLTASPPTVSLSEEGEVCVLRREWDGASAHRMLCATDACSGMRSMQAAKGSF